MGEHDKMSHYYGTLQGNRGEATRCGTKDSGIETYAATWNGAIRVKIYHEDGKDKYIIERTTWKGKGEYRLIERGTIE